MSAPTNRAEARQVIRNAVAECGVVLHEGIEDAIADMLLEQIGAAKRDGAYDVERKTLDPVFQLVGSAKLRLQSMQAFNHLQRHAPEMLVGNNHPPRMEKLILDAIEDLTKAEAADDRIPF